jgi:hypothetical protein
MRIPGLLMLATMGPSRPMTLEDYEKILRDAGWTAADIVRQSREIMHRAEKSSRWKILRQIRPTRGRDA